VTLDEFSRFATESKNLGDSQEEIIHALRQRGASQMESLKVIRSVYGVDTGEAKKIIDLSPTWSDMWASNQHLRSVATDVLMAEDPDD
jgi:ribosomal protein L7/L12